MGENFPVGELAKRGVMSKPASKAERVGAVLRFFGVGSIDAWEATYGEKLLSNVAFRHSPSFRSNPNALVTWLRLGEIEAEGMGTQPYDKPTFLKVLAEIRGLTAVQSTESLKTTQRLCTEAGVALAIVKPLPGTSLHAATRWLSPQESAHPVDGPPLARRPTLVQPLPRVRPRIASRKTPNVCAHEGQAGHRARGTSRPVGHQLSNISQGLENVF